MNTDFAPYIYTLASSILSGTMLYGIRAYLKEKKEQRKEHRFFVILLYSSIYASEQVIGSEWKKENDYKKAELLSKEEFVRG